ncbi:MAG: radical SAM protein [bacterium]
MPDLITFADKARDLSYRHHGKKIIFFIPGMFTYNRQRGKYPAVSLTGKNCHLSCRHCQGKLLETMIPATTPEELINTANELRKNGAHGFLLSGGYDRGHKIAWHKFVPAIRKIKDFDDFKISVHCGIIDKKTARMLKEAGVDQALIDVIGDDMTIARVYKTDIKVSNIVNSIQALLDAEIPVIPHIVVGMNYGRIVGEYHAVDLLKNLPIKMLVFVSLMPLPGTEMQNIKLPAAEDVARILIYARLQYPEMEMALGCARRRGYWQIDTWAIECGINRIALPAEEAIEKAKNYGLLIKWQKTCCSLPIIGKEE